MSESEDRTTDWTLKLSGWPVVLSTARARTTHLTEESDTTQRCNSGVPRKGETIRHVSPSVRRTDSKRGRNPFQVILQEDLRTLLHAQRSDGMTASRFLTAIGSTQQPRITA